MRHFWDTSGTPPLLLVPTCLVMYNSRSACSGSVSSGGLILRPQSHTLRRDELMFGDSWISGCEDKKWGQRSKVNNHQRRRRRPLHPSGTHLRLRQHDQSDQVDPHVGPQGHVPQQLRGLDGRSKVKGEGTDGTGTGFLSQQQLFFPTSLDNE